MFDIVDVMGTAFVGAAVALLLVGFLSLAALVRLLAPTGGLSRMPIPPVGVPARAAAVAVRIRAHVRDHGSAPTESGRAGPEPIRLRVMLGSHHRPVRRRAAA
jgi:hypothetical protein